MLIIKRARWTNVGIVKGVKVRSDIIVLSWPQTVHCYKKYSLLRAGLGHTQVGNHDENENSPIFMTVPSENTV